MLRTLLLIMTIFFCMVGIAVWGGGKVIIAFFFLSILSLVFGLYQNERALDSQFGFIWIPLAFGALLLFSDFFALIINSMRSILL